ncbi:TolC family protein [Rubricoccus marinus]|uniref:Transporter n=1 Tax=Rubricoccus marinus TaxID=716817 RepID=A0A259TWH7_9BACT|nr:TolC family protein [Rubricoccus marinus]OZC01934.1 hypothetical protein BSZ36_02395 [Rubricoccus marinus]
MLLLALLASGCAGVRPHEAEADLRTTLDGRAEAPVLWRMDADADREADAAVERLLADSLSADEAVQIALLNNRRLQATYEDLGVAQASLVQAGLLGNPVFGGRALWGLDEGGAPDLGFNVAFEFLDVLWIPMRRRVARSEYGAARVRVAEAVLDLAARTRSAYTRAQADRLRLSFQTEITARAEAAYTAALLLREAGTIPAADVLAEQARYEGTRLDLVLAEQAAMESRERLTRTMGLSASDYRLGGRLMPVPDDEPLAQPVSPEADTPEASGETLDVAALEARALESSLALQAARYDAEAVAGRLGLARGAAILPDLELGGELEREDGEWEAGPEAEIVLPLFDQGQARRAALHAELRRARADYAATAVDVRSATRVLASRLGATRRVALQYQRVLLALRADLTAQTLRQYNAMQTGVFGLLLAQEAEADAARRYADALAAYWDARTDLDALLAGRMPDLGASALPSASGAMPAPEAGH